MEKQFSLAEDEILELAAENDLTLENIIDLKAEFLAYDKGNKGKKVKVIKS